ncbi:MAG TPA: amidase [Woeseiaceae bacterium]|nr:amidase [Woeseiaceae bacterium]
MKRLIILACVVTLGACATSGGPDFREYDIAALQDSMQRGEVTSRELVQYYLDRIDAIDRRGPELFAIIELNPDALQIAGALDEERRGSGARGPLHGIPIVLKGNIDTGDKMSTSAGSLALKDHHPPDDAFLVARLREQGAVILGKANLSEWANFRSTRSSSGWSSIGGQTRNPYDPRRNPCGSSSGSAVAVSANLAAIAVGTETDGSIVCPASINGIVGIKPTVGLVSRDGIIPIAHSQDTAGPMARTVRDAALLLTALSARDPSDPAARERSDTVTDYAANLREDALEGKKIGVLRTHSGAGQDPRVDTILNDSIAVLVAHGAEIVDPIEIETEGMGDAEYEVLLYEFKEDLNRYLASSNAEVESLEAIIAFNEEHAETVMPFFGQDIMELAQGKGPLTDVEYLEALELSRRIAREGIDNAVEAHNLDALIAPSNGPAWLTDHINSDHFSVGSSSFAAVSGYASVTVPAGFIFGLPIGVSFIGPAFSEQTLIEIAYAFEQTTKARRAPRPGTD